MEGHEGRLRSLNRIALFVSGMGYRPGIRVCAEKADPVVGTETETGTAAESGIGTGTDVWTGVGVANAPCSRAEIDETVG